MCVFGLFLPSSHSGALFLSSEIQRNPVRRPKVQLAAKSQSSMTFLCKGRRSRREATRGHRACVVFLLRRHAVLTINRAKLNPLPEPIPGHRVERTRKQALPEFETRAFRSGRFVTLVKRGP